MPKKPNVKLISEADMGMHYVSVKVHSVSDLYICACVKYFRAVKKPMPKILNLNHPIKNYKILRSTFKNFLNSDK